jgi:hypothetical protein
MSERTTRQNQTRNLLLSLRKLTDDNIKHINWWLDGKPDGPVTRPWGRVAFFNRNTVRDAARIPNVTSRPRMFDPVLIKTARPFVNCPGPTSNYGGASGSFGNAQRVNGTG